MSEPFIAEIRIFGGNFAPRGWALCDGQLLAISQNQALFSILGTTYGGDGRTTFALPDLRGRVPLHPGQGPGLTERDLGERGGAESVVLAPGHMAAHSHAVRANSGDGNSTSPAGNFPAAVGESGGNRGGPSRQSAIYSNTANANMAADMVADTLDPPGGQAHPNMPPFLGLHYIIALTGIFPSRG
jgi:microcystin-dependent protein